MDELMEKLSTSHVSLDEADVALVHPKYSDIKRRLPEVCNQEKRRSEWLDTLKRKREDRINLSRGIHVPQDERMDVVQTKKPFVREYNQWLMLSEWLIEVPSDINENWICTICPVGKRALVVAEGGNTMAYKRNGSTICKQFPSCLPGGSRLSHKGKTILDTIFYRSDSTFYVLDVVFWGIDTTDFEAEMRFYWLHSKIEEIPELKDKSETNRYKFIPLDHFPYPRLQEKMYIHPAFPNNSPKVDGILFFHRNSNYVHSRSPLVVWLNPFMLPDILKMEINEEYVKEKPPEYQKMDIGVQDTCN